MWCQRFIGLVYHVVQPFTRLQNNFALHTRSRFPTVGLTFVVKNLKFVYRYTMVMIYYAFCLVALLILRPLLFHLLEITGGAKSVYAALYFLPVLVVIQAVFAGLICQYLVFNSWLICPIVDYSFPHMTIIVSITTSAIHFSLYRKQVLFIVLF